MKISINWLKQYLNIKLSPEKLIEEMNNIGLLVDYWEEQDGDVVLELETYANRPDTLGHLGVAREIAACLGISLTERKYPLIESTEEILNAFDVQVLEGDLSPRYCGMIVKDFPVDPSPPWLMRMIRAMGLSPVNNVVDITNYVLFSTAQPIHAFDLNRLKGNRILVRKARKGEELKVLTGDTISLTNEMLVIADEKRPVALAGVIGGEETAVTEETRDIFIESACFDPVSIRKAWKKIGIQTDASYRFERGTDISFPPEAARMTASLLTQIGGKALKGMIDIYPKPRKKKTVVLRHHRVSELLGIEIEEGFIIDFLKRIGFELENQREGIWRVKVPYFRVDIDREADLIEEIARFYGYDKIPSHIPVLQGIDLEVNKKKEAEDNIRELLFHEGFDEVVNFSFMDSEKEKLFETGLEAVEIRNPISSKASLLRTTLIEGLLGNIAWNVNRGAEGVHVFEIGNVFFQKDGKCFERYFLGFAGMIFLCFLIITPSYSAVIFYEHFNSAKDVMKVGFAEYVITTCSQMRMIRLCFSDITNFPAVLPHAAAQVLIFKVHIESFIHQTNLIQGFLPQDHHRTGDPINLVDFTKTGVIHQVVVYDGKAIKNLVDV